MTTNELLALAQIIKTETVKNKNSGVRIGTAFEEVVKKLGLNEDEISKLRGMVDTNVVIPTNSIGTENIKISAVTTDKTAFFRVGKNLFNINDADISLGHYVNYLNGALLVNAALNCTGFIPIIAGTAYYYSAGSQAAYYDFNKVYISGVASIAGAKTAPAGACYVRCSVTTTGNAWANFQVEIGASGTAWQAYTNTLVESAIPLNIARTSQLPNLDNYAQLAVGKNIFNINASDVAFGYYVDYLSGVLYASAALNCTGYIAVVAGTAYTATYGHQIAFFDANKVYISGLNGNGALPYTFTSPAGSYYVRCSVTLIYWANFQLEVGNAATSFEPFGYYMNPNNWLPVYPRLFLPRKIHVLANYENSIYHKHYVEFWNPFLFALAASGTNWRYYERYIRVNAATAGNLTIALHDARLLNKVASKAITSVVGLTSTNNGTKSIQIIGDSYCYSGRFFDYINSILPALSFVGMRKSQHTTLLAEGRSGWTLANYMGNKYTTGDSFSPFLHPADPYKYFGNTAMWIAVNAGSTAYQYAGFTDICNTIGFDAVTGLKSSPSTNDVMYNNSLSGYVRWDGSSWIAITEAALAFTFNYAKYLTTWGITMPDIVAIELGVNDFRHSMTNDYAFNTWKTNMDTMITSIKAAATSLSKTVKIAILTPISATQSENNGDYMNPIFQRRNMLEARRRILAAFDIDSYSTTGVEIVDTGSSVDPDYGFEMSEIKPFADFAGIQTETFGTNTPHPSNEGYKQFGMRLAAWIQINR